MDHNNSEKAITGRYAVIAMEDGKEPILVAITDCDTCAHTACQVYGDREGIILIIASFSGGYNANWEFVHDTNRMIIAREYRDNGRKGILWVQEPPKRWQHEKMSNPINN